MKTHKVGQDIVFTQRQTSIFSQVSPLTVLVILTLSFFISQCLVFFK